MAADREADEPGSQQGHPDADSHKGQPRDDDDRGLRDRDQLTGMHRECHSVERPNGGLVMAVDTRDVVQQQNRAGSHRDARLDDRSSYELAVSPVRALGVRVASRASRDSTWSSQRISASAAYTRLSSTR